MCAGNYVYDAVTPGKRHTCIAYFNVLSGLGVSFGAFAGSALVRVLGAHGTPFALLFGLSAALRLATGLAFRHCASEIRPIEPVSAGELWRALLRPPTGSAARAVDPQPD